MSGELALFRTFILADKGESLELIESNRYLTNDNPLPDYDVMIDWEGDIYGGPVVMVGVLVNGEWMLSGHGLEAVRE